MVAKNIFKFKIHSDIQIRARKLMDTYSNNNRGIRGNAAWVGWLGKTVFMDFFERNNQKVALVRDGNEFFVKLKDRLYQIKTAARRTIREPDDEWSCLVELKNWEKWSNHESRLFFSYYYEEFGIMYMCGYMERDDFFRKAKTYLKGQRFENMVAKGDLISVKLKHLVKMKEFLYEVDILRKPSIDEVIPKIKRIYRKYSKMIYDGEGDLGAYTFSKMLGRNPSEFKTNSQHLKAAKQYADMIRDEIGDHDISYDDIVPQGAIATYIKTDGGDGVMDVHIASLDDISNKKYQKGLWGIMRQVFSLLDIERKDVEWDGTNAWQKTIDDYNGGNGEKSFYKRKLRPKQARLSPPVPPPKIPSKENYAILKNLPEQKFKTLYVDPPWSYNDKGSRIAPDHKKTFKYDTIEDGDMLKVGKEIGKIADDDAHLWLWVTKDKYSLGKLMMAEAGFVFKTEYVWVKGRIDPKKGLVKHIGMGHYNRMMHEVLLFGVKGNLKPENASREPSVIIAPKGKHSAKPEEFYKLIERNSPEPRIELFARKKYEGFEAWGDQLG